jgi:two-component system phosphate regulon sensor histidine kinase PhoR
VVSVKARVDAGVVVVLVLFIAVVVTQFLVGDSLQTRHERRVARVEAARDANTAILQHMTDAETGVRGFQLTGDQSFLKPYEQGRIGAFTALDEVAARTTEPGTRRLLTAERAAAVQWLYAFAYPVVNAGVADPGYAGTARARKLFDEIRTANAAVDAALLADQRRIAAADRRAARLAQTLFALLAIASLVVTLLLASVARRQLLAPLEHIRMTLQRLAAGELSARAVPAGPGEMRAVAGTLNRLAAETERLLAEDAARVARTELRQAVAAALREGDNPVAVARRVAELIGRALGADAVHSKIFLGAAGGIDVCWPEGAPSISPRTVRDVLAGEAGKVLVVPHVQGGVAVPMGGDADCPPGLVYVVRHEWPDWTADERRLLATVAREIDHAVRQQRLHHRQARLITELRVLDERKDAFVATVTHELRTPLTSIMGYTEMLSDGDGGALSPLQQRGVTAILRNAHRLHETVADLLRLDRANNTVGATAERVDLAEVTATLHAEFEPRAPRPPAHPDRHGGAGPGRRRAPAAGTGAAQPAGQRDEVHPGRRNGRLPAAPGGRRGGADRDRHRDRHPGGRSGRPLHAVPPGDERDGPGGAGLGAGSGDRAQHRGRARWHGHRRVPAGSGQHLHRHPARRRGLTVRAFRGAQGG